MKNLQWLKIGLSGLLAAVLIGLVLPAIALGDQIDISSSTGYSSPDIEVKGQFIAVTYFKRETDLGGPVYVKSATQAEGWLTSSLVGFGRNPKLAFGSGSTVYVVWVKTDGKAIQAAKCTLSSTTKPACSAAVDVRTSTAGELESPDVVGSDDDSFVHVAWENAGIIETARSNSANSVSAWTVLSPAVSGGLDDHKPVLAWSNNFLHLAFLRAGTAVEYRRSADSPSHSWGSAQSFPIGSGGAGSHNVDQSHDGFDSVAITASGNDVFLAWDAHQIGVDKDFSLIRAYSSNNGTGWADPFYVPSGNNASNTPSAITEFKTSQYPGVPGQETGLQPSLVISGTADAALVWQECAGNCSSNLSDIYLAGDLLTLTPPNFSQQQPNPGSDYLIDPDVAVVTGTGVITPHFVYMRADRSNGLGGIADYRITYSGPFTKTTNDTGEGGGVYLPLIRKNS